MTKRLYLTDVRRVRELTERERDEARQVTDRFLFRSNDYYQSLIDWSDPADPIRRIIMPDIGELSPWGVLDASDEAAYAVAPGLEHKYRSTALLLVSSVCGGYCRFCFRKRLFMEGNDEAHVDVSPGLQYIHAHSEISNVLLTGGDPLMLSTNRLAEIIGRVLEIPHVRIVRIGSKMPAFLPHRIFDDDKLLSMVGDHSRRVAIYLMAHFNHPRELTPEAVRATDALRRAGAVVVNQTPLLRGVNDAPDVLAELLDALACNGISPYYVFQCRPTLGNEPYTMPVEKAYETFVAAQCQLSGLAKSARFVMSHSTGKIEVVGRDRDHVYLRYHQAADVENLGRMLVLRANPAARWLDDYTEIQMSRAGAAAIGR
jgi:KamA family protein